MPRFLFPGMWFAWTVLLQTLPTGGCSLVASSQREALKFGCMGSSVQVNGLVDLLISL